MEQVVYLLYGNGSSYQAELSYSVVSLLRASAGRDIRIKLICDKMSARPDLPVENIELPAEVFLEWTRGGTYWHEAKVHALKLACLRATGKVVLIDTDTAILSDFGAVFDRIDAGSSVMHVAERTLGTHPLWAEPVTRLSPSIAGYGLSDATMMYNSGVVGIDVANAPLLDDVVTVLRAIEAEVRVFNTEQLAFSMVLGERTRLQGCGDVVQHYWGYDRAFALLQIRRFFDGNPGMVDVAALPPELPRVGMTGNRWFDTAMARVRMLGRRSAGADYRFALIAARRAFAIGDADADLANVWAEVAAQSLGRTAPRASWISRDFKKFADGSPPAWLNMANRARWLKAVAPAQ